VLLRWQARFEPRRASQMARGMTVTCWQGEAAYHHRVCLAQRMAHLCPIDALQPPTTACARGDTAAAAWPGLATRAERGGPAWGSQVSPILEYQQPTAASLTFYHEHGHVERLDFPVHVADSVRTESRFRLSLFGSRCTVSRDTNMEATYL